VVFSHSPLIYWWPVWVLGYVFAILTWAQGVKVPLEVLPTESGNPMLIHSSRNLGVIYTVVFMLVLLFSNVTLRGVISIAVILAMMFVTVLFAYMGWWDHILEWIPYLSIHMNLGFYVFFSTFLCIIWLLAFFVFDRVKFWRIRPGQM